ncbi:MAG: sigma-54 dependent transcriptional regulator [Vicinamibacterales bacterium]
MTAKDCGAYAFLRAAQVNIAHCEVVLGLPELASRTFAELLRDEPTSIDRRLDIRGGQLALAASRHDWDSAALIDSEFGPAASSRNSVPAQWYRLVRSHYNMALGNYGAALGLAESCITSATDEDRDYRARVQLAAAEALARMGSQERAASLLSCIAAGPVARLSEVIAFEQRTGAYLAGVEDPEAALELFDRAARAFSHIGHMVGRAEARLGAAALRAALAPAGSPAAKVPHITSLYDKPAASFGRLDVASDASPSTMPDAVASGLRAASAMVDLMSRPLLAGYEFLSLAAASGAASSGALQAAQGQSVETLGWIGTDEPDPRLRHPGDGHVVVALGTDRGREVTAVLVPRNQQSARVTLLALQRLVANGSALHQAAVAESEKSALWPEPLPEQQLGFVAASESMLELLRVTRRVAASAITVLVTGETGTGKELLAHAIHKCSPRAAQRFLPFNCTAVARDMLDSQLFGYRRGAFTGAHDAFPGVIRSAAGGTLFLDEIGEIGLDVQPKLLRFLESSDVHPLGEPAPLKVDVRVVAATNADLETLVREGRFREDLYYRLNVVKLTIPPLRERREEIPLLMDHFLERCQKEGSKSGIRFSDTAKEYLLLYDWPGNVRELANEMRRTVALAESGAVLMPEHLSPRIAASRRTIPAGQRPPTPTELLVRRDQPLNAAVEHVERALIMDALRVHGNVEDAARALGLSRKGLYLKRQRLKIDEV